MKQTLQNSLKRLATGFISSVMMLSFVLMPIPRIGNVYAQDTPVQSDCRTDEQEAEDAYIPGCEFNEVMTTTTFESTSRYNEKGEKFMDKVPGFLEQYIVALTGVILINSLNYQRLYKYNPIAYGNDCSANFGPKFGIPVASLSGLSMMVGDLVANIKFQKLAKESADIAFQAKQSARSGRLVDSQKEDNKQIQAYNSLMKIIEGQIEALKVKKGTALASSIGYGVADGIEIANMISMNSICTGEQAVLKTRKLTTETTHKAAVAAISAQVAANQFYCVTPFSCALVKVSDVACGTLQTNLGLYYGKEKAVDLKNIGLAAEKSIKALKQGTTVKDGFEFIESLAKLDGSSILAGGVSEAAKTSSAALDVSLSQVEELKATSVATAVAAAYGTELATAKTQLATITGLITTCGAPTGVVALKTAVDAYTGAVEAERLSPLQCCGGDGLTAPIEKVLKGGKITENYVQLVIQEGIEQGKKIAIKKILNKIVNGLLGVPRSVRIADDVSIAGAGTLQAQGVPTKSTSSFKKDIIIKNLFAGKNRANYSPIIDEKIKSKIAELKFFISNAFEGEIRRLALSSFLSQKNLAPQDKINLFVRNNQIIDKAVASYKKYIENEFYYIYQDQKIDPSNKYLKNVIASVGQLIYPRAHAGLGATLVGVGVSTLGGSIEGPWSSVLKMGGNIITLHSLLGKFLKRTGLTTPVGRTLTWAAMSAMSGISYKMTKDSHDQAKKNLEIVKSEKKKFEDSAVNTGGLGEGGGGGAALNLVTANSTDPNGFKGQTACVKKDGSGYSPAVCGTIRSRSSFTVPALQMGANGKSGSLYVQGANFMSDFNTLAANGKLTADSFDDATLANMERVNNAIRAKNDKHRKEYDKMMQSGDKKIAAGVTSLQERVAKIRKTLLDNAGKNQLTGAPTSSVASNDKKDDTNKNESLPTGHTAQTTPAVATTPGMNLDFGRDDSLMDDLSSDKKALSMNDFEIKHDDINKKKDVSIFKILSNRYIMRYPKFMNEKKQ